MFSVIGISGRAGSGIRGPGSTVGCVHSQTRPEASRLDGRFAGGLRSRTAVAIDPSNGTLFTAAALAGSTTTAVLERTGATWSALGSPTFFASALEAAPSTGSIPAGQVVAAHSGGVDTFDGSTWSAVGSLSGTVSSIEFAANGDLLAGGQFTGGGSVARFDGTTWTQITGPVVGARVDAVHELDTGDLTATASNGSSFAGIFQFDGTSWSAPFTTDAAVTSADFFGDLEPRLLIGGSLTTLNSTPSANFVAEFRPTAIGSFVNVGVGCKSMTLTPENMPLIGTTYRSTATRLFNPSHTCSATRHRRRRSR